MLPLATMAIVCYIFFIFLYFCTRVFLYFLFLWQYFIFPTVSGSLHCRSIFIFICQWFAISIHHVHVVLGHACARRWMYNVVYLECGAVHKQGIPNHAVTHKACQYLGPQSIQLLLIAIAMRLSVTICACPST